MLAVSVVGERSPGTPEIEAGALAVAIARSWAQTGRDVLVVDADAHGTGLAERIGAATRTALAPARRGLPSLIAARAPLNISSLTQHCWRLAVDAAGSVRLLAAPTHPQGARRSAEWLAERSGQLTALAGRIAVVVSMPGLPVDAYEALGSAATHRMVLGGAAGTAPPGGARALLSAFGFRFAPDPVTLLLAAGDEPTHDDGVAPAADRQVLGRIGLIREEALLGGRARWRDRAALAAIDDVAARLCNETDTPVGPALGEASVNGQVAPHDDLTATRPRTHAEPAATAGANA